MYSSIIIATDIGRRQKSSERCLLQTDYRLDATLSIMVPCTYRITPCIPTDTCSQYHSLHAHRHLLPGSLLACPQTLVASMLGIMVTLGVTVETIVTTVTQF